jgi:hypothetical protein
MPLRFSWSRSPQVVVVGLNRGTEGLLHSLSDIADTPLSAGDVLLVQGPADNARNCGRCLT